MPQIERPLADDAKLILGVSLPHTLCSRRVLSHPRAQTEILRPAGCTRTEEKKDGHPLFSDKEGLEDPRAWISIKICHDDKERIQKDCFVICLIPASFITTDTETNTSCVLGSNRRIISVDGCLEWNRIADDDPLRLLVCLVDTCTTGPTWTAKKEAQETVKKSSLITFSLSQDGLKTMKKFPN